MYLNKGQIVLAISFYFSLCKLIGCGHLTPDPFILGCNVIFDGTLKGT